MNGTTSLEITLRTNLIAAEFERFADLQASHQRCRNQLQAVCDWLRGEDSQTVKSRQAFEQRLHAALLAPPRH